MPGFPVSGIGLGAVGLPLLHTTIIAAAPAHAKQIFHFIDISTLPVNEYLEVPFNK
jgi:hypothetical protein